MKKLVSYFQLMRFHRPIGFLLLLWPTLWALWIASNGLPPISILVIFVAGVFIMRAAGCVINDIADRHFDGAVARTKNRPLITGAVSITEAVLLFALLCLLAFALVLMLHFFTILLSLGGLAIAMLYPFAKRWMPIPQLILGIAFAWSIPMVFAELTQHVSLEAWLLFFATVCWTIAYDTQYALADRADDLVIGIQSSAILFGSYERIGVAIFHIMMILILVIMGNLLHYKHFFFVMLFAALCFAIYQQCLTADLDANRCIRAFKNNNWLGAVIFLGISCGLS